MAGGTGIEEQNLWSGIKEIYRVFTVRLSKVSKGRISQTRCGAGIYPTGGTIKENHYNISSSACRTKTLQRRQKERAE